MLFAKAKLRDTKRQKKVLQGGSSDGKDKRQRDDKQNGLMHGTLGSELHSFCWSPWEEKAASEGRLVEKISELSLHNLLGTVSPH